MKEMQRGEDNEAWRANLTNRNRRWAWKGDKTCMKPSGGRAGSLLQIEGCVCIMQKACDKSVNTVSHTCASKHCAITGLCVKVNVYFSWAHFSCVFGNVCPLAAVCEWPGACRNGAAQSEDT